MSPGAEDVPCPQCDGGPVNLEHPEDGPPVIICNECGAVLPLDVLSYQIGRLDEAHAAADATPDLDLVQEPHPNGQRIEDEDLGVIGPPPDDDDEDRP